jgi:hypothetical protein
MTVLGANDEHCLLHLVRRPGMRMACAIGMPARCSLEGFNRNVSDNHRIVFRVRHGQITRRENQTVHRLDDRNALRNLAQRLEAGDELAIVELMCVPPRDDDTLNADPLHEPAMLICVSNFHQAACFRR